MLLLWKPPYAFMTGKAIYTTFQHMKGISFGIQRTCLYQSVFELPLSHLSPCCAIHFLLHFSLHKEAILLSSFQHLLTLSLPFILHIMSRDQNVRGHVLGTPRFLMIFLHKQQKRNVFLILRCPVMCFSSSTEYSRNEESRRWFRTHRTAAV